MVLEDGSKYLGYFPMKEEPGSFSIYEHPGKFHVLTAFGHGYCGKDMSEAQALAAHIFAQYMDGKGIGPHSLERGVDFMAAE